MAGWRPAPPRAIKDLRPYFPFHRTPPEAGKLMDIMSTPQALALFLMGTALLAQPPAAQKRPVTDTYHGVAVTDEYRWLENGNNEAVRKWSDAQNARARAALDKLPGV